MTKYLETKTNSIEEAIKGVVLGEKIRTPQKLQRKMQLKKQTNFDFRLFDNEDSPGSDKANDDMNKEIVKASKMKDKGTAYRHMLKIQKKHSKHGAMDTEPREMINAILARVFGESVNEGYEANVMKILKRKGLEGAAYFKNNNLMVSKRDFDAVKKALRFDKIPMTPPKIVVEELDEDERMKKLTKRQRQALARVQAKPKSQVSLPKMPDFMKLKKEENEMDIVDTIKGIVEKKLDPVNKDAVKKKFDDRKDKDIDNDGDVDSTDKYLHKRRKAISKAISKEEVELDEDIRKKYKGKEQKAVDMMIMRGGVDSVQKSHDKDPKKFDAMVKRMSKNIKEVYDIGKDYAQHTLEVTPGQDKKDVDKMLNVAYTKNQSMRETLAKVWGLDEGKSPFQKEEEKPLTKTMTGQKPTTVKVNPKIEEK